MNDVLGDLQRRLANMVRRGVIHSVRVADGFPECRVDLGDIVTTWLPLCQGFAGKHRADFEPFAVGDAVTVLSEAGELNNGRVFAGWNTGQFPYRMVARVNTSPVMGMVPKFVTTERHTHSP